MFYIKLTKPEGKPRILNYRSEQEAIDAYTLIKSTPEYDVELLGKDPSGKKPIKTLAKSTRKGREGRAILSVKKTTDLPEEPPVTKDRLDYSVRKK